MVHLIVVIQEQKTLKNLMVSFQVNIQGFYAFTHALQVHLSAIQLNYKAGIYGFLLFAIELFAIKQVEQVWSLCNKVVE